jgi:hypothetical protein
LKAEEEEEMNIDDLMNELKQASSGRNERPTYDEKTGLMSNQLTKEEAQQDLQSDDDEVEGSELMNQYLKTGELPELESEAPIDRKLISRSD